MQACSSVRKIGQEYHATSTSRFEFHVHRHTAQVNTVRTRTNERTLFIPCLRAF